MAHEQIITGLRRRLNRNDALALQALLAVMQDDVDRVNITGVMRSAGIHFNCGFRALSKARDERALTYRGAGKLGTLVRLLDRAAIAEASEWVLQLRGVG